LSWIFRWVGRGVECDRISGVLADARHGAGGVLVLSGEAGIGKSALCGWAVARADGMRVLWDYEGLIQSTARMVEPRVEYDFDDVASVVRIKAWRAIAAYNPARRGG
jgi:hypothetical protein